MRELLLETIAATYERPHNRLDEVFPTCSRTPDRYRTVSKWHEALAAGEISIREFLGRLTDEEMIDAFRSQCCQDFR